MVEFAHTTVLLHETVSALRPSDGGTYIDCTVGAAGHSALLLQESSPTGRLLGLDQDEQALQHAVARLSPFGQRATLVHANFRNLSQIAPVHGFASVDGIVFDLGVSSPQFDVAERGFSYRWDALLDMRMDRTQAITAGDIVNHWSEEQLAQVFYEYGEEKFARAVAKAVVRAREHGGIRTTGELADLIKSVIPAPARRTGPHPARRVFQALRIAVNDELGALEQGLEGALDLLKPGGRIAVITFHSLEDRLVKRRFVDWSTGCTCPPDFPVCQCGRTPRCRLVTRKAIVPTPDEIAANPRSRSAKLRVVEKV